MNDVVEKNINPLGYKSSIQRLEESNARLEESNVRLEEAYEQLEAKFDQLVNVLSLSLGVDKSSLDL
ncbi:MAG: hypothetical protein ACK5NF_04060 [Bacilli bacterium]